MRPLFVCLVVGLLTVACSSGMPPKTAPTPPPGAPASAARPCATSIAHAPRPMVYRFGIGDELEVDVWQEEELSATLRVLGDGTISPSLIGTINVAGRTIDEAREMMRRRYKEYLKEPEVSVRVTAIHSDRVFVLGELDDPKAVELKGRMTLMQAIAEGGGFVEETADKSKIRLIRTGPDGQPLVHVVNGDAVLAARAVDPVVQRGDVVFVPSRGVTNWSRTLGQALAPFAVALGAAGSTAAIVSATQ